MLLGSGKYTAILYTIPAGKSTEFSEKSRKNVLPGRSGFRFCASCRGKIGSFETERMKSAAPVYTLPESLCKFSKNRGKTAYPLTFTAYSCTIYPTVHLRTIQNFTRKELQPWKYSMKISCRWTGAMSSCGSSAGF